MALEELNHDNLPVRYAILFIILGVLAAAAQAQSSATLAPTGTLRAVFLGTNPVHGRVDPTTGIASGPVPDLVRELAARLNVPYRILPAPDVGGVIEAMKTGTADIGFLAYDESRAREVDFGASFIVMFSTTRPWDVRANTSLSSDSNAITSFTFTTINFAPDRAIKRSSDRLSRRAPSRRLR